MTTSTSFSTFLNNIKVDKSNNINSRYKEITKKLNRTFRDTNRYLLLVDYQYYTL